MNDKNRPKGKKRMKKVFVLVLFAVFGTYAVKAQDDSQMEKEKTEVKDDGTVVIEEEEEISAQNNDHKSYEDRTRAGQTVDNVGHGAVQGVRGAGKGIGNAASWTWDNAKHNKVTKKIFDQPENAEERQLKMEKKAEKKEVKKQRKEGVASTSDNNTGEEMKEDVNTAADETGDAASAAWNDTKHNKATKEAFDQPGDVDQNNKSKDKDKEGKSKETETKTKDKGDKEVTKEKKTKTDKDGNSSVKKEKEKSY